VRVSEAVVETDRLVLRRLTADDAEFILELLNDPAFLRHIGDKGVRTRDDARRYVETGPVASYERHGFGLLRVELKDGGEPIGICGLLKRDALPDPDIGFALLARHRSKGYGYESASAVLAHARDTLGLERVLAVASPDNAVSIGLLERLGFRFERMSRLAEDAPEIEVFSRHA
jgi:RimJ/RimL family protein N-acetyltransferase